MPQDDFLESQGNLRQASRRESMSREFKIERKVSLGQVLFSLGLSLLLLAGMVVYMLTSLNARSEQFVGQEEASMESSRQILPQAGSMVTVVEASSLWRHEQAPVEELIEGTRLYPEVKVTLKAMPEAAPGAIRLLLFDQVGNIRGDSLNLDVERGLVVEGTSAVNQVLFQGSDGLQDETVVFAQHLNEKARWSLKVFEGPFKRADFEDFTLIAEIPITAQVMGEAR